MDDLTGKWARLSLNTRETQTIPLAPEVENNNRVLVAKLFTKRRVNIEALSRTLKTMWRSIQNFEVRDLTSNTVLILFSNEVDAKKILSQGPWSFDKYLIGLYKPSESESVDDAKFDTASFWVQIHNLPLSRMNRANAEIIGSSLGKVEQVDASPTGECRGRCITWRLTGFYGHPDTNKREETWTLLESLGRSNTLPWLCLGDYNEILSQTEKAGGRLRPARQMDRFRMAISHCGFLDLGYRGSPFTWSRNHPTEGRIRIRLDRALATVAWKSKFPGASVQHLSMSASDHSMIAVHLPPFKTRLKRPRPPFRFEAMWLHDPRCAEIVEEAWMEGLYNPNGAPISNCLESCRARLSAWNKTEFGHVGKQIARLEKELQSLEQHPHPNHEKIEEVGGSRCLPGSTSPCGEVQKGRKPMVEELKKFWSKLSFTEEEDESLELGSSSTRAVRELGMNCVVMKGLTHRSLSLDTLRKNMRMLWKPNKGVQIFEIEEVLFLVEFGNGKDKKKILDICPWSYKK
nr:hypothetical protein CFP56_48115 [Quercus suber]